MLKVLLPANTEAHVVLGETLFSSWEPSRKFTQQDVKDVAAALISAGLGDATSQAIASRWALNWRGFEPERTPSGRQSRHQAGASWYEGEGQVY